MEQSEKYGLIPLPELTAEEKYKLEAKIAVIAASYWLNANGINAEKDYLVIRINPADREWLRGSEELSDTVLARKWLLSCWNRLNEMFSRSFAFPPPDNRSLLRGEAIAKKPAA